ncbi:hypothetical protein HTZ77_09190 [Nonomuraea sp. SMC257]|uniref:DUF4132 domain-containing protein n=1 Tax=Nonomuraea montanisoli TaxID=2741721 RepID=A0A7Y6I6Z5_9ACTN|nr:hypothetical protein [Nonomuraea montanisoli]NUW31599.1 hypothetical protein [Nonomuraea montanisoli]
MSGYHWAEVPALVEAATVEDWTRPLAGAADVIEKVLRVGRRIPDSLLRDALAVREPRFLAAVLDNARLLADPAARDRIEQVLAGDVTPFVETLMSARATRDRADVRERLAATGRPEVVERAHLGHPAWSWRLRREVVAAAEHPDPSPVLDHARRVLESGEPELGLVADQLDALLTLHDHAEDGLERLARVDAGPLRPEVAGVLRTVLDTGDAGVLRAAAERAEGVEGLLAELYDGKTPGDHRRSLEWREPLDWAALTAAARKKPFVKDAAAAVTARPDCPGELRVLLYARHPTVVAENAAHLDVELVRADCNKRGRAKATRILVSRGLGRGISGADLAAHGAPAVAVLEAVRGVRREYAPAVDEFTERLSDLVEKHLGDDVGAWRSARALLKDFPGTIPDLLAEAAASKPVAGSATSPMDGEWPDAASCPYSSAPSSYTGVRLAFATLLDAAADSAHEALTPHLDGQTTHDLYRLCAWRPGWPDQALATAPKGRVSPAWILAGRPGLDAEAIERLMSTADPEVLLLLFWHAACTDDQRARIIAVAEERPDPEYAFPTRPEHAQNWRVADLYACSHTDLFDTMLRTVYVLGPIPQLRLFLHVWRTWGAEAVAAMLSEPPVTFSTYDRSREVIEDLLRRPDRRSALAELETRVAEGTSVQAQIAMWRTRRDRAAMFKETHRWHWAELLAEHRREPFHGDIVGLLPRVPDCPEEFRREAETVLLTFEGKMYGRLMSGIPPEKVLATFEIGHPDGWLIPAIEAGRVTWAQAVEHGFPAENVLRHLNRHGRDGGGHEALSALMRDTLKDSPEAWLLAVSMLPGFTGSITELLRTAATAVG